MEEAHCTTDPYWGRQFVLLVFVAAFGVSLARHFEWLRKAKEYNEQKDRLLTFMNHIEAALSPPRNLSRTPTIPSVTQIKGRCLPSCLAQIVKMMHGTGSFDCNLNQCGNNLEKDEGLRGSQGVATSSNAEQDGISIDIGLSPTELQGVGQYLANAVDTRLLIQERRLRKQAEVAEVALNKVRAAYAITKAGLKSTNSELESTRSQLELIRSEYECSKSEHDFTKVELTNTKTQLADRDTSLEEAKMVIESLRDQVHTMIPTDQLQQNNNEPSGANDESAGTIAQLQQEIRNFKQCVAELEKGKTQPSHSADKKTEKVEEVKGRSDDDSKQAPPKTSSTNGHFNEVHPADGENSTASEMPEISPDLKIQIPAMTVTSATNTEQSLGKEPSTVSSRGLRTAAMSSTTPASLSIPRLPLIERSTPASPLIPLTPDKEDVPADMKRFRNCRELVARKAFFDVHSWQCECMCTVCGASVPIAIWKAHHNTCAKCRYCDLYSSDWKWHTKICSRKSVLCDLCKDDIPREELEAHKQDCKDKRRRQDCNLCNEEVLDIKEHLKRCAQATTKLCGHCRAMVNKHVFGDHFKINCTTAEASRRAASAAQIGTETSKNLEGKGADLERKIES
jgi:hypothetical protein